MDVYSVITNRIIEKLEEGCVPWHKPWRSIGAPRNLVSKKLYGFPFAAPQVRCLSLRRH